MGVTVSESSSVASGQASCWRAHPVPGLRSVLAAALSSLLALSLLGGPVPAAAQTDAELVTVVAATATTNDAGVSFRNPMNAFDGIATTTWISGVHATPETPQTLTGEFDGVHTIDQVRVAPRPHAVDRFGNTFSVEARVEGSWTEVLGSQRQDPGAIVAYPIAPTDADALRLVISGAQDTNFPGQPADAAIADVEIRAAADPGPEPDPALHVTRVSDDLLDPEGHARSNFSGTANVSTYQQDGIITYKGWQYAAWYRDAEGSRNASVISRRQLPDGDWDSFEVDFDLLANDSHNNISLAVSPSDGRIHIAFGQHGTPHRYTRTAPGVADDPTSVEWSSALFSPTRVNLPGIEDDADPKMTYPTFEVAPDPDGGPDRLLLTYREGSPSGGEQVLVHYNDDAEGTWTHHGSFSSGVGEYTTGTGTSTGRNGYLHGFSTNPATGDIEITWTWREGPGSGGCLSHDLGYASSPDLGLTWFNTSGEQIATTGADPITIDDDHVAVAIGHDRNLINSESHFPDSDGRLHVITSHVPDDQRPCAPRATEARPFHHWRDLDGTWHSLQIPTEFSDLAGSHWGFGRGNILVDDDNDVYVVDPAGRILGATAASGWTDWGYLFEPDYAINKETMIDRQRLAGDGLLSVAYQEQSSVTTPTKQTPAAFRVADFAFAAGDHAPRSTEPEMTPVPFDPPPPETGDRIPVVRASATSSSGVIAYRDPMNAFDGDLVTTWISGGMPTAASPQILTGEFDGVHAIDEVLVAPRPHQNDRFGARTFTIETRLDGTWTEVESVDEQPPGTTVTYPIPRTQADAIRLVITDSWDTERPVSNVGVAEVQARSTGATANERPTVDDLALETAEDTAVDGQVVASDPDGDPLTFGFGDPAGGTVDGDAAGGSFTYTPDGGFVGDDAFTVTVDDGNGGTATATVTVTVTAAPEPNRPPAVDDLALTTDQDTPVDGEVSASDPDGDPLTFAHSDPANGTVTAGDGDGFTYTPDTGFSGTDRFAVAVSDGRGGLAAAVVEITVVAPPPARPTSKDDCKDGGWRAFTDPSFRNQGRCIAWVHAQQRG